MPRDSNGNYTLPAGNPVITGTVIQPSWANPSLGDIGNELTNSLDRQGRGGMLAPFKFLDGTAVAPGMTWTTEPTMGFYRASASVMAATVAGVPRMRWTGTGVDVWDTTTATWLALTTGAGSNFAMLNVVNAFTVDQRIYGNPRGWYLYKDATPTKAARFSLGVDTADYAEVAFFDGGAWVPFLYSNTLLTYYRGNRHTWMSGGGAQRGFIDETGKWTFGPSVYAPTAASVLSAGLAGTLPNQRHELGLFIGDGLCNPRAAFFMQTDGVSANQLGIDWTFGAGTGAFEFRRVGTPIFNYDNVGVHVRSGMVLDFYTAGQVTGATIRAGTGTPEGVVTANVGSLFLRLDGGANTTLYVKQTGTGNTGWAAK